MASPSLTTRGFLGQARQLPGRLVAQVRAGYGADIEADVQQTALHAGMRPCVPEGLADAAAPIIHGVHKLQPSSLRRRGVRALTPRPVSRHRQRVPPALVLPFFFISPPHHGHLGAFMPP